METTKSQDKSNILQIKSRLESKLKWNELKQLQLRKAWIIFTSSCCYNLD